MLHFQSVSFQFTLPVLLVGVLLVTHPGAGAPHELLLELGVDEPPGELVALAGAGPGRRALVGAELGGVLGAAQLVLARVLHVVGAQVGIAPDAGGRRSEDGCIFGGRIFECNAIKICSFDLSIRIVFIPFGHAFIRAIQLYGFSLIPFAGIFL